MALISAWMISRGSRYSGTPSTSIPPATFCASKTVGAKPISASSCAHDSPAGPGPYNRHLAPLADGLPVFAAQLGIDSAQVEVLRLHAEALADKPLECANGNGGI